MAGELSVDESPWKARLFGTLIAAEILPGSEEGEDIHKKLLFNRGWNLPSYFFFTSCATAAVVVDVLVVEELGMCDISGPLSLPLP